MTYKLKALGIALAAIFTIGVVVASAASAQQGVLTSDGLVTLTGTETGVEANRLTAFGLFVECPGSTYTGHKYNVTPHTFISSGATTITISPKYKEKTAEGAPNCKASSGTNATVDLNGCDYVAHLGQTTPAENKEGTYGVTFDVVCPAGKEITVTVWLSENAHTTELSAPQCILHIPSQTSLSGAHATETGNGTIDLTGTIEGLTVKQTRNSIFCPAGGGGTSTHDPAGKFDLDVNVTGKNEFGEPTAITLGGPLPVEGALTSDGPVTLTGTDTGVEANRLEAFGAFYECPGSTYTGHKYNVTPHTFISSGATTITISPKYKEKTAEGAPNCKGSLGTSATIDMNGCDYVAHLGETTPAENEVGTYGVTFDVVCPAGKEITVTVWFSGAAHTSEPSAPKCIVHVPPQNGLSGAHATETGNGTIDLTGTITGVTVKQTRGSILCPAGTHTTEGKFKLDVNVTGKNEVGESTAITLGGPLPVDQGALTSDGPVTLTGTDTGVEANRLEAFGAFYECPGSTYTGHKYNVTPHTFISSGATTITISPKYKEKTAEGAPNCKGSLGTSATIDMNGCDYVAHLGETTPAENEVGTYGVTFDVVCPAGKEITVTIWLSESQHTTEPTKPKCIVHIPSQAGLSGAHATETGNGTIDLTGTIIGITAKQTRNTILCPAGTHTIEGKFKLDVNVTGKNEAGAATAISLSHP
jgi:uncharacterized protein (DUF1499 family)